MFDARNRTALHFSMPMDAQDWANLAASGCKLVQIPWAFALYRPPDKPADPTLLSKLTAAGYGVILRMGLRDALALNMDRARLRAALTARLAETNGHGIEAVIVFNEPDIDPVTGKPFDLTKGSASWHQAEAKVHAVDTGVVIEALGDMVRLVAAPLSNRALSEDAKAEPGLMEWWTELRPAYHHPKIKGVGCHIYEQFLNDDPAATDVQRAKHKLWLWGTLWQPGLWNDEFAILHGTALERARAWCSMIRWLQKAPEQVELFSPFVSNGDPGNPPKYDPALIVRDPAAYAELAKVVKAP